MPQHPPSPLTAREVCQVLSDVALGERIMTRGSIQSWSEIYHGLTPAMEGCRISQHAISWR
ncbi:DUF7693 family protein [Pseudomonas silesiensis]|uniref:DUF7693 family protein n=1 Tax=Pseudomonas silesiensis TaxID=1853130 RepID=UPI003B84751E